VRYDGGHKLDALLVDTLGRFVEWVPVCPEVEMVLSVPRDSMRSLGIPAGLTDALSQGVDAAQPRIGLAAGCGI
jgi:uncharacterized protein YbbK (DUF523 family)